MKKNSLNNKKSMLTGTRQEPLYLNMLNYVKLIFEAEMNDAYSYNITEHQIHVCDCWESWCCWLASEKNQSIHNLHVLY